MTSCSGPPRLSTFLPFVYSLLCCEPGQTKVFVLNDSPCFLASYCALVTWIPIATMHKHSLSVPTVPASAPTSPACTRLNRSERLFAAPVTPQRLVRPQKASYRSPVTPASTYSTPYTPLSLRSFSTASSSTITTPGSASSFNKRYTASPSTENDAIFVDKSLADIAENWRSRANDNGIKVSSVDDSNYGDDEGAHTSVNCYMLLTQHYEILVVIAVLFRSSVD